MVNLNAITKSLKILEWGGEVPQGAVGDSLKQFIGDLNSTLKTSPGKLQHYFYPNANPPYDGLRNLWREKLTAVSKAFLDEGNRLQEEFAPGTEKGGSPLKPNDGYYHGKALAGLAWMVNGLRTLIASKKPLVEFGQQVVHAETIGLRPDLDLAPLVAST